MTELIFVGAALAAARFFTSYHTGPQIIKNAENILTKRGYECNL